MINILIMGLLSIGIMFLFMDSIIRGLNEHYEDIGFIFIIISAILCVLHYFGVV